MLCRTFEILILLSGLLPDPDLNMAAMGICIQLTGFCFMFALGLAGAVSYEVGPCSLRFLSPIRVRCLGAVGGDQVCAARSNTGGASSVRGASRLYWG